MTTQPAETNQAPAAPVEETEPPIATKKDCPVCGESVSIAARKCIHCQSDLNWKRYLSLSTNTLAMLTAFIAVLGAVGPSIKSMFEYRDAFLTFTFVGGGSLRTAQPDGRVTNGTVVLLGTNEGRSGGGLVAARINVFWETNGKRHWASSTLRTPGDEPIILGPGAAASIRLLNDPQIEPEADTSAADLKALIVPARAGDFESAPLWKASCNIGLTVANTASRTQDIIIPARCAPLFPAIRGAIEHPGL